MKWNQHGLINDGENQSSNIVEINSYILINNWTADGAQIKQFNIFIIVYVQVRCHEYQASDFE